MGSATATLVSALSAAAASKPVGDNSDAAALTGEVAFNFMHELSPLRKQLLYLHLRLRLFLPQL